MTNWKRAFWNLLLAATAVTFVGSDEVASGQDENEPIEAAPAGPREFSDEQLDQWAFGGGEDAVKVRGRLDLLLALRIEYIERICGLTEAQRKKLSLSGRGDIKRLFDRIETSRTRIKASKDPEEQNQIAQELYSAKGSFDHGFFGEGSLFSKTLKASLNEDQVTKYQAAERDNRRFYHRARVDLAVEILDRAVGFRDEQRRRITKMLVEMIRPIKRCEKEEPLLVLLSQMVKLPDAEFALFLDDSQWALLKALLLKFQEEVGSELDGVEFDDLVPADDHPAASDLIDNERKRVELSNQRQLPSLDTTP